MTLFKAIPVQAHSHQARNGLPLFVFGMAVRDQRLGSTEAEEDGFSEAVTASVIISMGVLPDISYK